MHYWIVFDELMEGRARKGRASQIRTEIYCLIKFLSLGFFALRRGFWFADLHRKYRHPADASVPRAMRMRMDVRMETTIRQSMGVPEEPFS